MKKTNMTGLTFVVELRLSAIDVGFSLRDQCTPVEIPHDCRSCGYDGADGHTWLIEGTPEEIREALINAGYVVTREDP